MSISLLIILSIIIAIALGYKTKINTGLFAMTFAYLIGCLGLNMKASDVISTWPISIFFVIFSVSLFYNFAVINGTLEKIAMNLLYYCRNFPRLLPLVVYFSAALVAGLGAGFFTVLAFFAPITLLLCKKTGMSKMIGSLAVCYGALSGANFMTSTSGIVFRGLMDETVYAESSFAFSISIFAVTFIMPIFVIGLLIILLKKAKSDIEVSAIVEKPEPFNATQRMNLILIFAMLAVVLAFPVLHMIFPQNAPIGFINTKIDVGLISIIFSVICMILKLGDQKEAIDRVPWNTLIMICGVGMLIQVAIRAGTIDLLAGWISASLPNYLVPFAIAVVGICMSFFSSALGVICPALFPIIPSIAAKTGIDPMLLFTVTVLGAQTSSLSPFSSGGSLMLGSCSEERDRTELFPMLMFEAVPICILSTLVTTGVTVLCFHWF